MEIALDLGPKSIEHRLRIAVMARQAFPAAGGLEVGLVNMNRYARQPMQPGHMVFMDMTHDHHVGIVKERPNMVGDLGRIEDSARVTAGDDQLVAVRVFAVLFAEADRDRSELRLFDRGVGH